MPHGVVITSPLWLSYVLAVAVLAKLLMIAIINNQNKTVRKNLIPHIGNIMTTTTQKFATLQSVNAKASGFIEGVKKGLETSAYLMPSLTYHVMVNGNDTMLNKVLSAVPGEQRKYMLKSLMVCAAFASTKAVNNNGEQLHVKRLGGNRSEQEAAEIAGLVPDWRILMQADKTAKAAARQANKEAKAEKENAEKTSNSDSNVIELHGTSTGQENVRTDIALLVGKITDLVKGNKVTINDQALAASFLAWFKENDTLQVETVEKATGTHGK